MHGLDVRVGVKCAAQSVILYRVVSCTTASSYVVIEHSSSSSPGMTVEVCHLGNRNKSINL